MAAERIGFILFPFYSNASFRAPFHEKVVCEQGKLIKISNDKHDAITRDVPTKKWTDWLDYWAVDFNYESRKEIIKVPKRLGGEGELPKVF